VKEVLPALPAGNISARGIPFHIRKVVVLQDTPVLLRTKPFCAPWIIFLHTVGSAEKTPDADGFFRPARGPEPLNEQVAEYVLEFADGRKVVIPIRRRREIVHVHCGWPIEGLECVPGTKPRTLTFDADQMVSPQNWGWHQTRANSSGNPPQYWMWAWQNPFPARQITSILVRPIKGTVLLGGITAGYTSSHPLRWGTRQKAILRLPKGEKAIEHTDTDGNWKHLQLDLGQVIEIVPRRKYDNSKWKTWANNQLPDVKWNEVIVEYTCHAEACFHLPGGERIPVASVRKYASGRKAGIIRAVQPADTMVTVRVVERGNRKPVPVKLHIHGESDEYLPPVDRHRHINPYWFQDYSTDFSHLATHHCTYIPGETRVLLPQGRVYVEVSRGFEIRPVHRIFRVTRATREIAIEIDRVLHWRNRGWVTADTHVHFLSPQTAMLEGSAEGVNVVNLLASQWGELMTNVGDFDGRTTHGSIDTGGDGEYLVRVGTENRQGVLGHISLLGYNGRIIAPMTTGGPPESALGDPVNCLLADWARQCRKQKGVVVLPHHPRPRAESAAVLVGGLADGVEMTSGGNLYWGIDPYSLSDWYRFLNCGYMTAAVGGTDKMSAGTAVGTVRTYALLDRHQPFTYETWKAAIRKGRTFVTYGPLMEFTIDGKMPGSRITMRHNGGTVDVTWELASVTVPMTRVELMVNGETRASKTVSPDHAAGSFTVRLDRSSWLALLIRGRYRFMDREMIAAHSSPVVVEVAGTEFGAAADMLTILEQIEGSLAFLDTVGTRAATADYRRMRMQLIAAHRSLHNRMHRMGFDHGHGPATDHAEHHR